MYYFEGDVFTNLYDTAKAIVFFIVGNMNQRFRRNVEDIPTGNHDDSHEQCRQRTVEDIQSWTVPTQNCHYCGTKLLLSECSAWCCGVGNKIHRLWTQHSEVVDLYHRRTFGENSRMMNSLFTTATLYSSDRNHGLTYHYRQGGGPPAMRISGQMYARFLRSPNTCWFLHDTTSESRLPPQMIPIARQFGGILQQLGNPFANFSHLATSEVSSGHISLCVEAEHNSVYAVFVGQGCVPPARQLYILGSGQRITEESPIWELALYPLWHPVPDISRTWHRDYRSTTNRKMTLLNYLKSVMLREPHYWICSRLAHQHVLDTWSRNEQQMAKVWRSPAIQSRIRAFVQQTNGRTSLFSDKLYLPASVPGSFRYQQRFFHDALYIASKMGNPHLFITMTANTHWPEVRMLLRQGESGRNRLDAIARAFNARRQQLLRLLNTPNFLFPGHQGLSYYVYVTEWQLCGLPHLHLACQLKTSVPMRTEQQQLAVLDAVISARYPEARGIDYDYVESFMTHNNPCRVCLRPNPRTQVPECRFYFPKPVSERSYIDAKGFPVYKRGRLDTRVVPHNIKLLRALGCHCNVEWVFSCTCIAYLYKYLTKGYDSAGVRISDHTDEIAAFRRSRVLSGGEATYRSLGYKVNFRDPAVILCKFTLPPPRHTVDEAARLYVEGDPDLMHDQVAASLED